jgi:hypothetical protein
MPLFASWKPGYRVKGVDVEKAHAVIKRIDKRDGGATAQALVDAGRSKRSPIHAAFTWDDTAAAEKCRLAEGAYLLRAIEIKDERNQTVGPAWVNLEITKGDDRERSWHSLKEISSNPELREQAIRKVMVHLHALRERLAQFSELMPIVDAIDAVDGWLDGGGDRPQPSA